MEVVASAGDSEFGSPVIAQTRLVPPRSRTETVDRPALVRRRLSSPARLGVISGPAGSGKSTLLAQCHAADPSPAWLSLWPEANDPVVFWWSLISSLRTIIGDFGDDYRHRLLNAGDVALDDVVTSATNELVDHQLPVHLFLDDVHLVENPTCRRTLHRFVSSLPAGVRVTIASRDSSPLPLARRRVEGELIEITAADLAFSADMAHELVGRLGATIDSAQLELLVDRTEGWPAGLQLAGIALTRTSDPAKFVRDFHGTDHDVADYLIGEVLDTVMPDERDFMIETSVLSRLSGELCDAVTGRHDGSEMLARLERTNAFIIPLDRNGRLFRYHHLFAELLTAELQRRRPGEAAGIHTRAYEWLRDDGEYPAAISHALAAGERDAAADVLCANWFTLMGTGRLGTVRALLDRFADHEITGHQPLAIAAAFANGFGGQPRAARRFLEAAEQAAYDRPPPDGSVSMESSLALTRGSLALDGVDAALADGMTAHRLEPPGSTGHQLAALIVGLALVMRGDADESTPYFERVDQGPDEISRVYALAELSLGQLDRGEHDRGAATAAEACRLVAELHSEDLFVAATAHAAAALAAVALGDERQARIDLRTARRPMESLGQAMPLDATHARILLARAALAVGEQDLARHHLSEARAVTDGIDDVGIMREQIDDLTGRLTAESEVRHDAPAEFTEREVEVIALLGTPLTTKEIGEELFLSRNTVKTYLRRIYRKLGAASREEASLIAERLDLAPNRPAGETEATASPG
jgi:LuxR family maltose regulon positive regulatory protein